MVTALNRHQLAMTRNCLSCKSDVSGRMLKLNKEKFRLKKTELFYMHMGLALTDEGFIPFHKKQDCIVSISAPTNQQRRGKKITWCFYLPLTIFRRFFNQVRTTENSAEDQGLPTILCVIPQLSKFLDTWSKHFTVDFFEVASQTTRTFALKIEKRVVYHHSYDLGA